MRAVTLNGCGGPEVLTISEIPRPEPGPEEVLLRVHASALNHADTMQRKGTYAPPPGQNQIMGVEVAGEVVETGASVTALKVGDRVLGLIPGGGYAEYCVMHEGLAVPVPDSWDYVTAAAVPEVYYTAHETMFEVGGLKSGQSILIHAAGSGVGSAAIQMAAYEGAKVLCTAGSNEKIERAQGLGAWRGINYKTRDFVEETKRYTNGEGVDMVVDFIGGPYLTRNLACLKNGGTLVQVGAMAGGPAEIDLLPLILNRYQIKGYSMRGQDTASKVAIARRFGDIWLPRLVAGDVKAIIHAQYPIERVAEAHAEMDASRHFGKIILTL